MDNREMISRAQSLQRGGSSDQQAAGRRNEEQQQQNVDVDNSHGAGDHSSDEAKDDEKELAGSIKSGILLVCSFFATFCLDAILNLPGGIKPEQLQSKPMNITADELKKFQSFLSSDASCFFLSVTTIFLVTFASSSRYKYSLHLNSFMMGALVTSATVLFYDVLELATSDHLAHVAFQQGFRKFFVIMAGLFIFQSLITKKFRSFIRKEYSKIRDLIN